MNGFYFFCPCCHHYLPTRVRLRNLRQLAANDPSTRIIACLSHFLRFSPRRKQKDFFLSSVKIVFFCHYIHGLLLKSRRKKRDNSMFLKMCMYLCMCVYLRKRERDTERERVFVGRSHLIRSKCSLSVKVECFEMALSYICW